MADKALSEGSVTIIGSLPPIKGISPYCYELMTSLSNYIHVDFIGFEKMYPDFLYPGGKSKEEGIIPDFSNVSNVSIRNFLTYYNPFSWIWAGLSIKSKIVHAQWWSHVLMPPYFVILLICKLRGKKILITTHNVIPHETNKLNWLLNGIILLFGNRFIVHSESNINQLHDIYNIPLKKIIKTPHGILKSYNNRIISQSEAKEKLGIPIDSKVILFFGHIREYKGLDVLLESFSYIVSEMKNVILLIAGSPWEPWSKYEEIIEKNKLSKNIRLYLEFIPSDSAKYFYYSADLVVLPYKWFDSQSGVGSVVLSFGKPLIVTNVGGLPEFVKDANFVVEPNNPRSLSDKLLTALRDDNLIKKLSADSISLAEEYSWDKVAQQTIHAYQYILKEE